MLTSVLYFTCKLQLFCIPLWWCLTLLLSALIKAKLCKPSKHASKHARSDPASYGQCAARIGLDSIYAGSDFPHPFQLRFFQRRHGSYCAKLTWVWSGWPGQDLDKHIWSGSKLVCRNHLAQFLAGGKWPATSFQLLDLFLFIHKHPE